MDTTRATLMWDSIKLRSGTYQIGVSRWVPDGVIYGVNLNKMSYHPFEGLDWHTTKHTTDGDYDWISISGDFTFVLEEEHSMFKLFNFDSNLDNYPRRDFL
jgi:hypothetical protein